MEDVSSIIMGASEEEAGEANVKKLQEIITKAMEAAM